MRVSVALLAVLCMVLVGPLMVEFPKAVVWYVLLLFANAYLVTQHVLLRGLNRP